MRPNLSEPVMSGKVLVLLSHEVLGPMRTSQSAIRGPGSIPWRPAAVGIDPLPRGASDGLTPLLLCVLAKSVSNKSLCRPKYGDCSRATPRLDFFDALLALSNRVSESDYDGINGHDIQSEGIGRRSARIHRLPAFQTRHLIPGSDPLQGFPAPLASPQRPLGRVFCLLLPLQNRAGPSKAIEALCRLRSRYPLQATCRTPSKGRCVK